MAYRINPDRNIPWNGLPELPIDKTLYEDIEVLTRLGDAKAAIGRLQGRSIAIPNQAILINTISLQEAKASSAIENIFTTDDELYKAFSEQAGNNLQGPAKEVLNYREALWQGFEYLQKQEVDTQYLVNTYRTVTQYTDGIRTPVAQTYIKQGGSGPNAGKAFYTPPRGKGIVETKLNNLLDFLNNDERYSVDPLLKMAIGHLQFEAIHPFRDGNGRTGRIINIHMLTKKGLLDYPILYLSRYILEHKHDYYSGLAGVTQRGDWKNWIIFMLRAVESTSNNTYYKINDIIAAKEAILQAAIEEDILRPEPLVNALFTQPFTKVKHLTESGLYAENTARKYLDQLAVMGVLEKRTMQGNVYYLNSELYRILSE
ncbi:Fic family protein [soil metagenome]